MKSSSKLLCVGSDVTGNVTVGTFSYEIDIFKPKLPLDVRATIVTATNIF